MGLAGLAIFMIISEYFDIEVGNANGRDSAGSLGRGQGGYGMTLCID